MIILNSLKLTSRNPAETRKIARLLSRGLRGGDTVALRGQLGSGKTVFVKGLAAGLGLRGAQKLVTSPTFALVNLYEADWPVYHMDWYRLSRLAGDDRLMVDECLADRQADYV
ncbi:MAG: tRNA (adenosine(37)-N6)-threonylcarbamoyltransferase complex ATPase subunit type 1 TsaE [Candidatus Omnitrophota bacterium]